MDLSGANALVVGAGSLGSPALIYLAAAGVGRIGVVDHAEVDEADPPTQPLHFVPDAGIPKTRNAAVKLSALNPAVQVEEFPAVLDAGNAPAIVAGAGVVLDCSGDPATSLAVNDACCAEGATFVAAEVGGLGGWVLSVIPGRTACRRCAFGDDPGPATSESIAAVAGILGSMQALEAIELLSGDGSSAGRLITFDGETMTTSAKALERREDCPACAETPAEAQST